MKIVNKKKFLRSISIVIGLVFFILLLLINTCFSHTEVKYKEISIVYGDSLWNIARYEQNNNPYFENKDIRYIVNEIKCTNNLNASSLMVGQKLNIPTV